MMKPTIEEIIQDFTKWHGSKWVTPNGVKNLYGIEPDGVIIFGGIRCHIDNCNPVKKPMVVSVNASGMLLLQTGRNAMFSLSDGAYDEILFIQLTESVKEALKKGGVEYGS